MSIRARQFNVVGLASATSANGTGRNGAALNMNRVQPGTVIGEITGSTTTTSVVATYKWQGSMDNFTTAFDLKSMANATSVTTAAGTASPVPYTIAFECPISASAYTSIRMVATLSGAPTAGADVTQVTYRFLGLGAI